MVETIEFEVLSSASNAVVARHPGRAYPGVLIQGDSLRIILSDIDEIIEEVRTGNPRSAEECAGSLREKIADLLCHYERALDQHGVNLPYVDVVGAQGRHQ